MREKTGRERRRLSVGLSVLVTAFAAGCGKPAPPENLVVSDLRQPAMALLYVAQDQGYFKAEGLEVGFRRFTSGRDALEALYRGEIEVATAFDLPVAAGALAGKPLRILGTLHRTAENAAIVARRDRGIAGVGDLKGKRIGLTPGTNTDYMLSLMLGEAGLGDDGVIRLPYPPDRLAAALAAGEVDAVSTWMPHVANAVAALPAGQAVVMRTPAFTELSMLVVQAETIQRKPESLRRLLRALVRAGDFVAREEPAAVSVVVRTLAELPPGVIQESWDHLFFGVRLDNVMLSAIANETSWLAARQTPRAEVPDLRGFIHRETLESIRATAVTIKPLPGASMAVPSPAGSVNPAGDERKRSP